MKSISGGIPPAQLRRRYVAHPNLAGHVCPSCGDAASEVEMAQKLPAELFSDINEVGISKNQGP